ncbi:hypothetical protein PV10_05602 [Exophiala mesophila]|uniref:GAR domain-containing protein n=1 Tax=Exophiala mesophila TaxID=212818 RepID=A0A0D1ZAN9_EXOME|nr:uncharacterized protein PV10_05602 [Exophiala mesophila]KIV91009.1 hypothetical protein PV10_05602 [Exophiala mesophila]
MATLTTPTKPQFPRLDPLLDERSPSKSPRRKAQFAVRELDPLLANLSPHSTLRALQATDTIPGGVATQDALTTSIIDATPAEREIGIRAAFAAQKLREWLDEVSKWNWPARRDRAFGLGFLPPPVPITRQPSYIGSLTSEQVTQYEIRFEEIRDDLDSLDIDDIKDHVLAAHVPSKKSDNTLKTSGRKSYGRMRDFTALITATVIQALPDLAKLNILLDQWDVRLRVLRSLPKFRALLDSVQQDIKTSFQEIRSTEQLTTITDEFVESKKSVLGEHVSDLGRRADRFLDILEGHEDSLPQVWIDTLEKIELDYATWVVEAHRVALRNKLASGNSRTIPEEQITESHVLATEDVHPATEALPPSTKETSDPSKPEDTQPSTSTYPSIDLSSTSSAQMPREPMDNSSTQLNQSTTVSEEPMSRIKPKPSLTIALPEPKGHRRDISKISVAESMLSVTSDISNAEIMDATRTSVMPSPKINMVDNPLKIGNDDLTWFGPKSSADLEARQKPPMLQRASTASIEVVPSHHLKRVMLTRSASFDMLTQLPETPSPSTPTKALKQLVGENSPTRKTPFLKTEDLSPIGQPSPALKDTTPLPSPTPSLLVEPLRLRTKSEDSSIPPVPTLPRRSSKRQPVMSTSSTSPLTPVSSASPMTPVETSDVWKPRLDKLEDPVLEEPVSSKIPVELATPKQPVSLDDKIQDLLTSLPTKIRLAKDTDNLPSPPRSNASTRSSTPTPGLTLSAVRSEASSRKSSVGDSEIRLYHLTRAGQARDTPPVKLFVRTIGDGNRVMVRVGGGWADLGEYLKEYSLHHGSRTNGDGRLEVARFPVTSHRDSVASSGTTNSKTRRKSGSPLIAQNGFESNAPGELVNNKIRRPLTRTRSPDVIDNGQSRQSISTMPPVPSIPTTYTTVSPTMATISDSTGAVTTTVIDPDSVVAPSGLLETPGNVGHVLSKRSSTISNSGVTTTTSTSYTPLGAAGPRSNKRASSALGTFPGTTNDAWVEGLVGKARAVSGGPPSIAPASMTTSTSTTTTTTTTTTVGSAPRGRRTSYWGLGSSPASNRTASPQPRASPAPSDRTVSPSTSTGSADVKSRRSSLMSRPKNRMSLGDIGGIKRVFLRKKTGEVH